MPIPLFEKLREKFLPGNCKTGDGIRFGSNRFFRSPRRSELTSFDNSSPSHRLPSVVPSELIRRIKHPTHRISGYAAPAGCLAHQSFPPLRPPAPRDELPNSRLSPVRQLLGGVHILNETLLQKHGSQHHGNMQMQLTPGRRLICDGH